MMDLAFPSTPVNVILNCINTHTSTETAACLEMAGSNFLSLAITAALCRELDPTFKTKKTRYLNSQTGIILTLHMYAVMPGFLFCVII